MDEMQQTDLFEKYLRGEMTGAELAGFEQKLADDPSFLEKLAAHRLALLAGERLAQQNLTAKFAEWGAELDQKGAAPPKGNRGKWAAVLLAGLLAAILFFFLKKDLPETLPTEKSGPPKTDTLPNFKKEETTKPIEIAQKPGYPPVEAAPKNLVFAKKQMAQLLGEKLDSREKTRSESPAGKHSDLAFDALRENRFRAALDLSTNIADRGERAFIAGMAQFQLKKYGDALLDFRLWEKEAGASDEADWCILMSCIAAGDGCAGLAAAIRGNPGHAFFGEIQKW